jgi:DNA modification methylase
VIIHGDSLEILQTLEDESVDAIVTDPPYGLGNTSPKHVTECLRAWAEGEEWSPKGSGFMGRAWDAWVPPPELWREVLRVLKKGGHALVFAGSRTQDLMSVSLRLAGFEVRDTLMWLYGNGFPKSLNVSKAIDKQRDDKAETYEVTAWIRATRDAKGLTNRMINERFGVGDMARHWTDVPPNGKQPSVPPLDQVPKLLEVLGVEWDDVPERIRYLLLELNSRKGQPAPTWFEREVIGEGRSGIAGRDGVSVGGESHSFKLTASATDAAKTWEGWGTALKPAYEPIILARKPMTGTVAANVLEHGTGALNIDACRVGEWPDSSGRYPANVVVDDHVAEMIDEQGGGFQSRFFYTPKASRGEREAGLPDTGKRENIHPTVKPLALMRYLVKMITPPSGTVLDPFAGSGSTLIAAALEGFEGLGIEREAEFVEIARQRVEYWRASMDQGDESAESELPLFNQ